MAGRISETTRLALINEILPPLGSRVTADDHLRISLLAAMEDSNPHDHAWIIDNRHNFETLKAWRIDDVIEAEEAED